MSFDSIIPGERRITDDEMRTIENMARSGRNAKQIALHFPDLDENRIAALLAPKRPAPKKMWKGRR